MQQLNFAFFSFLKKFSPLFLDSQTHYGNKLFLYEKLQNTEKWKLKEIKKEKYIKALRKVGGGRMWKRNR
jgi:hypothetical protein